MNFETWIKENINALSKEEMILKIDEFIENLYKSIIYLEKERDSIEKL